MCRRGGKWSLMVAALTALLLLGACAGDNDPVLNVINKPLDVEFKSFYVDRTDVYPGESIWIEWRADGAFFFDVRLYISKDDILSGNDLLVVDEECGIEYDDHCSADEYVDFICHYQSDNSFTCRVDGDVLQRNDLTSFIDAYPQEAFLIMEICNDNCELRSWPMLFR